MYPVLFKFGELSIYSYPFVMGVAWAISFHLCKYYLYNRSQLGKGFYRLFAGVFVAAWIGAKVLFLVNSSRGEFMTVASNSNFWMGGGFVFYGGLIGGIIFVALFSIFNSHFKFSDSYLLIPTLALAHSIGRVGCLLAGCCFGKETDSVLAVHLHGAHRHPVQLYESLLLFILFLILHKQVIGRKKPSTVIFTYLGGYSLIRFALEFIRGDKIRGVYAAGISSSQMISIAMFIIILLTYIGIRIKDRK